MVSIALGLAGQLGWAVLGKAKQFPLVVAAIAAVLAALFYAYQVGRHHGAGKVVAQIEKQEKQNVIRANKARHRVRSRGAAADCVRDKRCRDNKGRM